MNKLRSLGLGGFLAILLLVNTATAQFTHAPMFESSETLHHALGLELLAMRINAFEAVMAERGEFPADMEEQVENLTRKDLVFFAGTLESKDAELLELIENALESIEEATEESDAEELAEAHAEMNLLLDQARTVLLDTDLYSDASIRAALMAKLLLTDDGVAEGYEDALEAELWEYPGGWAALQRVTTLWESLQGDAPELERGEVDQMLAEITDLFPSASPPDGLRGDPEAAEGPAQRMVGFLERITDASLYTDRDPGPLATFVHQHTQGACDAFANGHTRLGYERMLITYQYYASLADTLSLLLPEAHAGLGEAYGMFVIIEEEGEEGESGTDDHDMDDDDDDDETLPKLNTEQIQGICTEMLNHLQTARDTFGS